MKEKELHKLKRQDLLELLLDQSKDVTRLQEEIDTLKAKEAEMTETLERLKGKLDDKDAQIEHLKERLDNKDARIKELEAQEEIAIPMDGKDAEGDGKGSSQKRKVVLQVPLDDLFSVARTAVSNYLTKME